MSDYTTILNRMMARVPAKLDKRVGSIIYDALAPTAMELAEHELLVYIFGEQSSLADATGLNLDNIAANFGITRREATAAVRIGEFTNSGGSPFDPPIGSRFSTPNAAGGVSFILIAQNGTGQGLLQCEIAGESGNEYTGQILPLSTINNLGSANLIGTQRPAENEERDDALRERVSERINRKAFGGNVAAYKEFTKAIDGVGDVKVFPAWENAIAPSMLIPPTGFLTWLAGAVGIPPAFHDYITFLANAANDGKISTGGTILESIVDGQKKPVTPEFVAIVQDAIDPIPHGGEGLGVAPIGHRVTVTTPDALAIDIAADLHLRPLYTPSQLQSLIEEAIEEYLSEVRREWADAETVSVFMAQIIRAIMGVEGVANVTNVTINGSAADLAIPQTVDLQQIPVLGSVVLANA